MNDLTNQETQQQFLLRKASVGHRLGAYFIDYFIITAFFSIFSLVFLFFPMLAMADNPDSVGFPFRHFIVLMVILLLAFGFRDSFKGRSIGKRLVGIGVRDSSDSFVVPSVGRLFLRQIFTFLWPIEFIALLLSDENRKIGDFIANTGVYNLQEYERFIQYTQRMQYINQMQNQTQSPDPNTDSVQNVALQHSMPMHMPAPAEVPSGPSKRTIAIVIIAVFLAGFLFIGGLLFVITSSFRNHPSYQLATDYIRANPEIAALIGDVEGFGFFPMGSINTSPGRGDADFTIRTRGTYGDVRAFVTLQRRDGGEWQIVRFNFVQIR